MYPWVFHLVLDMAGGQLVKFSMSPHKVTLSGPPRTLANLMDLHHPVPTDETVN